MSDRVGTFSSLAIPTYRLLFWSGAMSFLAVQAQFVARGWLANELTGSNTGLGAVYMVFGVAMLVSTPLGGVVADRVSRRSILIATQIAFVITAVWIGLGVQFGFVEYWMLMVTAAIQAAGFSFLAPARMAMTSDVVGRHLLTNAIVLGQLSMNATRVVGPALAGIGIGIVWFGLAGVYFASGILSAVGLLMLLPLPAGRPPATGRGVSPLRDFNDGLRYVCQHRQIGFLILVSFVVVMVAFPYVAFLPRVATELFDVGPTGYGLLSTASAIGAVGITFFVARRASVASTWKIQTIMGFGFGIGVLLLAGAPLFWMALLATAFIGGATAGFQAMNNALVIGLSEADFHGRLQSLMMLSFSGFGMAALPLGILADAIGLRTTLMIMGAITIAAMVVYLIGRPPLTHGLPDQAHT
jgi:MFS family permease